jgi:hypothetical protein
MARLTLKTLHVLFVKNFDRHEAAQKRLPSLPSLTHSSGPDESEYFVRAERLADHEEFSSTSTAVQCKKSCFEVRLILNEIRT